MKWMIQAEGLPQTRSFFSDWAFARAADGLRLLPTPRGQYRAKRKKGVMGVRKVVMGMKRSIRIDFFNGFGYTMILSSAWRR